MSATVLPLVYFGNLAWWKAALQAEDISIGTNEKYVRQSLRNRTQIMGPNKLQYLSVPVKKNTDYPLTAQVEIAYNEPWQPLHLRSLQAAYGKSPYYVYYMPYIENVIAAKNSKLRDLNAASIQLVCKLLKHPIPLIDDTLKPNVMDEAFATSSAAKYSQVFESKHGYVPNLSILDLLFNVGPEAKNVLLSL